MRLIDSPLEGALADRLARPPGEAVSFVWLGQAGFVIDGGGRRVVLDPYLSDSLAQKYRGKPFDYVRMMPAPIDPGAIAHVDAVLATHAHTDHLDPGTLAPLMAANAQAALIVPRSALTLAAERSGRAAVEIVTLDAHESLSLDGLTVSAMRAAHEEIETDADGHHRFLGLAIELGGATILHTGDTIPFAGQADEVRALAPDVILAPVNGRDRARRDAGVPGNMTAAEALALAEAAGVADVVAHHFGMFAFNTVARADLAAIARSRRSPYLHLADTGRVYRLPRG